MLQNKDFAERSKAERGGAARSSFTLPFFDVERVNRTQPALPGVAAGLRPAGEALDVARRTNRTGRLGCSPAIGIGSKPPTRVQAWVRQILDRLPAVTLLAVVAPTLLPIALAVRPDGAGPVLFRQPRVGRRSRLFAIFGFRTMCTDLADLGVGRQTTRGDPRVARIGQLLCTSNLDERPPTNRSRGETSRVGPQPHTPNTRAGDELFPDAAGEHVLRHGVKPGVGGWAQANRWRGRAGAAERFAQRFARGLGRNGNRPVRFGRKILAPAPVRGLVGKAAS